MISWRFACGDVFCRGGERYHICFLLKISVLLKVQIVQHPVFCIFPLVFTLMLLLALEHVLVRVLALVQVVQQGVRHRHSSGSSLRLQHSFTLSVTATHAAIYSQTKPNQSKPNMNLVPTTFIPCQQLLKRVLYEVQALALVLYEILILLAQTGTTAFAQGRIFLFWTLHSVLCSLTFLSVVLHQSLG